MTPQNSRRILLVLRLRVRCVRLSVVRILYHLRSTEHEPTRLCCVVVERLIYGSNTDAIARHDGLRIHAVRLRTAERAIVPSDLLCRDDIELRTRDSRPLLRIRSEEHT